MSTNPRDFARCSRIFTGGSAPEMLQQCLGVSSRDYMQGDTFKHYRVKMKATFLFLDEPTSALDIGFQIKIMGAFQKLCNQRVTICAIFHDLNLTKMFADQVIMLKKPIVQEELSKKPLPVLLFTSFRCEYSIAT